MKILLKNIATILAAVLLTANAAFAGELAYIVKQDGRKVFLDISENKVKPKAGANFRVVTWGDEIVNPKTGKSLGREAKKTVTGKITQVEPMYAVGTLDTNDSVVNFEAEFRAIEEPIKTHTAFSNAGQEPQVNPSDNILPLWQSKPIEGKARAVAAGDIDGDGASELILGFLDGNEIKAYNLEDNSLKEFTSLQVNKLRRIISLDAADVKGTGKAQVFAVVYDEGAGRLSTYVYELKGKTLEQTDTISGVAKGIAPYNGKRIMYRQDISSNKNNYFASAPAPLTYKDNKFSKGEAVKVYNFESIFGFNKGDFRHDGRDNYVFTKGKQLRIQFDKYKHFIDSPQDIDFGTTPNRISFDKSIVRFPISVGLFKDAEDNTFVVGVENLSKYGMLADTFGSYATARMYNLKWTGNSLVKSVYGDIEGVVYDIFQGALGNYGKVFIVPAVSNGGMTSVVLFPAADLL